MEPETIVDEPEVEGEERKALRLLLGGRMRRSKLRRLALAHLLREGDEGEEDDTEEEEGGEERRALRLLVGGRILRRRKLRRLVLAHLLRERAA